MIDENYPNYFTEWPVKDKFFYKIYNKTTGDEVFSSEIFDSYVTTYHEGSATRAALSPQENYKLEIWRKVHED